MSDSDERKPKLLVVDDSRLIRASFVKTLGDQFEVEQCEDGEQALDVLNASDDFNLIFTDLSMPRMDGYELLQRIRDHDNPAIREIPVIIVTGKEDSEQDKERMLNLGATDLITKPFHSSELLSRARGYATLRRKVAKLEKKVPLDSLTGLATREYLIEQGEKHLALARRQGLKLTVARLGVANLEDLKRDFGVPMVAKMFGVIGKVLRENLRTEDLAAYLGSGQFALLLPGADPQSTVQVWARLRHRIAKFELKVGEKTATIDFSTGIASQNIDASVTDFLQLMQRAEANQFSAPQATGAPPPVPAAPPPPLNIDELLEQLADNQTLDAEQVAAAMRALLPLLRVANRQLGLNLGDLLTILAAELGIK